MIHKLKRDGKLTTGAMQTLLCPALSRLDLESVYVTTATMKAIMKQCPNLKELSLKSCGYIVTDHLLQQLFKVSLNFQVEFSQPLASLPTQQSPACNYFMELLLRNLRVISES